MMKDEKVLFYGCNDYSLDKCTSSFNPDDYYINQVPKGNMLIDYYYHKGYHELHYVCAPASWQGMVIE